MNAAEVIALQNMQKSPSFMATGAASCECCSFSPAGAAHWASHPYPDWSLTGGLLGATIVAEGAACCDS